MGDFPQNLGINRQSPDMVLSQSSVRDLAVDNLTQQILNRFLVNYLEKGGNLYYRNLQFDNPDRGVRISGFIGSFEGRDCRIVEVAGGKKILVFEDLFVIFEGSSDFRYSTFEATLRGSKERIEGLTDTLASKFKLIDFSKTLFKWYIKTTHGHSNYIVTPKEGNYPLQEMYPFLEEPLESYYTRFHQSSASILLLKGPPGTGKTTFILGLLQHLNEKAMLTYDEELLAGGSVMLSEFMTNSYSYLILEDADTYLSSRSASNNKVLQKLLNAGDGLISQPDKKIIFTTNLENLGDIDPALVRPGRCFDILDFKPLTSAQTKALAEKKGLDLSLVDKTYTVAEIFNTQKYTKSERRKAMGFDGI